ncbi:hypothetical protein F4777DRAFT_434028 [Nemania sp. FL0916]|nr:hypothetical protein F4777DRAFT_434028 [Nemania sp. FL0916]
MASHAWLNSLSEDWVSQPGSDPSLPQLPTPSSPPASSILPEPRDRASRIPRFNGSGPGAKRSQYQPHNNSSSILGERSRNDINIRATHLGPSRLSQETKATDRGRCLSRTASDSTPSSVIHNSVLQSKSRSASSAKARENIPEWRRRLVYGEIDCGESKDLFSSAATGLENMFRQPQAQDTYEDSPVEIEGHTINETTLPSSPPPYFGNRRNAIDDADDNVSEQGSDDMSVQHNITLPKPISFRSTADDSAEISRDDTAPTSDPDLDLSELQLGREPEISKMSFQRQQLLEESRKISGQSDTRNEDFSPIFLARHSSEGGGLSFAPMELPAHQLRKKLEVLRRNQMILDPELGNASINAMTSSEGVEDCENTEEYAKNGGFLNLQRGGRSMEGSFRCRPLSPPMEMDTSEMLPESSLQASTPKQFPTVRTGWSVSAGSKQSVPSLPSPSLPRAPRPSPEKRAQPAPTRTATSPLKLFGPYDTFTNQTLLRRISQYEDQRSNSVSFLEDEPTVPSILSTQSKARAHYEPKSLHVPATGIPLAGSDHDETPDTVDKFGTGELDDYVFDGDISVGSTTVSRSDEKENITPPRTRVPSATPFKFDIREDTPEAEPLIVGRHRRKASRSVSSAHHVRSSKSLDGSRSRASERLSGPGNSPTSAPKRDSSEGKRPRTSPSKDPTPKRRRTLHPSDVAFGHEQWGTVVETVQSSHQIMQSALTGDAKHIRQGQAQERLDTNEAELHNKSWPCSPTSNQHPSEPCDRPPLAELSFNPTEGQVESVSAGRDLKVSVASGPRKSSMQTKDFLDAAEQVMAMIRNRARPMTGLASVEESEADSLGQFAYNQSGLSDDSYQESTREPFTRPPSRDGRPVSRLPIRQDDPELIKKLKKYEEHDDFIDMLGDATGSMGNLQIADQKLPDSHGVSQDGELPSQGDHVYSEAGIISDIPNVRISRSAEHKEPNSHRAGSPSQDTRLSDNSTGRSVPTNSSRGSDSKRLISPNVVAQLIGNQVGNMVFDDAKKMWQKVQIRRHVPSILPSEDTEEDPFASIPDLTVDSAKEELNINRKNRTNLPHIKGQSQNDTSLHYSAIDKTADELEGSIHSANENNHVRAETAVEDDEEIDHEISLHEDRIQKATPSRRRGLTITFSSPIASIIQDIPTRVSDDDSSDNMEHSLSNIAADSLKRGRHRKTGTSVDGMSTKSSSRSRHRGTEGSGFIPRPVSRIDEQDENEFDGQNAELNEQSQIDIHVDSRVIAADSESVKSPEMSVIMATPNPARAGEMYATPIIGRYVGTLSLSPLSAFTVHQTDKSCALEVSYVVDDEYLVTGDGSKKTMSKAVRSLVEKITEVEPFEPDWESVPEIDLSNKQLDSLHMLDEFCTKLVTLDASNNAISHLDGVPQTMRNLRMTHNALSELTSWGHLMNLQYIDISNNQITSLSAFKNLVHLRSLRADNNQITSLDGIKFHDSLQVLRARGNQITRVDFDGTQMRRLTELDLENNLIMEFESVEQLTSLATLNLQHNCLTSFAPSDDQSSLSLKYLKLSNNDLETIDVMAFPSLRLLHLDHNQIKTITGLSRCQRLDSLSLREQKGNRVLDTSFLDSACEVRKLFLSGNRLSGFEPRVDFLNLQYLELANCGLQSLALDIGQLMPNLRTLNINFNAIADLWPLRYIPRLKKLLAVGNRLHEAGKVASMLAEFPHLSRLDLRNNGATLGFYAPVQTLVSTEDDGKDPAFDPFVLPDANGTGQEKFESRLDINTKMRKRVYDMVILGGCKQLKMLDGLSVSKDVLSVKDEIWKTMVENGLIAAGETEQDTSTLQDCEDSVS